jgi:hypothetical protein
MTKGKKVRTLYNREFSILLYNLKYAEMKKLIFFPLLLLSICVFSQTDYYQYDPITGTYNKIGYSTPSNVGPTYTPYINTNPTNAMVQVGILKQQQYENNLQNLQSLVNDLSYLINSITEYDSSFSVQAANNLDNYISRIKNLDFSDENIYQSILANLNSFKEYLEIHKDAIIKKYYKSQNP